MIAAMPRPHALALDDGARGLAFVARVATAWAQPMRAPVTHAHAAVVLCTAGHAECEQHARWSLDAGDVLLVPAGQPHRMIDVAGAELIGVGFCVSCVAAYDGALLDPFDRVRAGGAAVLRVPAERQAWLAGLFRELDAATREPRRGTAIERSLLTLILDEIARAAEAGPRVAPGVVADSLRFIERNCLRRLTLTEVAAAVGKSPAYVTTALSRETGRSAGAWITAGRMAEARRLLLHSDEMVDVIGERVGYADPTHFIRMFRREHGVTPAAWRARSRAAR